MCTLLFNNHKEPCNQGLVAARSRLSKKGLTIPRLELVAGHMAVNLATNVRAVVQGHPIHRTCCWLDSTVALYWIKGQTVCGEPCAKNQQSPGSDVATCSYGKQSS